MWLNALLGTGEALELRYADAQKTLIPGALVIAGREASVQFQLALHGSCDLLGTSAWIRPYDGPEGYQKQWKNFSPLRCVE